MTRKRWPPTRRQAAYALALVLGLAVAAVGYANSFDNLSGYAAAHGWRWPAALPIGLDLGIPALLLLDWLRASMFLRAAAWSLAGFTVFANGAVAGGTTVDRLLHAMMPAVAIVIIEAARHLRDDPSRMDRIRLSRWLLSPVRTARLWRRMVLWEITSYREALTRESAILHARTVLVSAYGHRYWWRTRRYVPASLRHQLTTGQLPSSVLHGLDLQTSVRTWVQGTLAELADNPIAVPANEPRTEPDPIADSEAPAPDPWDLVWVRRDSIRPTDVSARTFAQAFAVARDHFEQAGTHITQADLRDSIKIAKPQSDAIHRVIRSAYESGPVRTDQNADSSPPSAASAQWPVESAAVLTGRGGPDSGLAATPNGHARALRESP